ncbi:uncharacterized protein E5676_scaffold434G004690 [Cucumis melo var. makuwa]|uniref:Uncharacterized protein n=1 Tax=Cucumis melo var. makuwa TaxID=1194695 RepID=A0A5D3D3K8_CUCMM|nr:uncharacterized protein E5676_scaffold434G004690 [Cucumis melo var. makuwa]
MAMAKSLILYLNVAISKKEKQRSNSNGNGNGSSPNFSSIESSLAVGEAVIEFGCVSPDLSSEFHVCSSLCWISKGLYWSLFDFRHGRTSRKLLADKKHPSRQTVGNGNSRNKFEILANLDEDCSSTLDIEERKRLEIGKPSVKKLIEEEMSNEQDSRKIEYEHPGHLKTSESKKTKKSRKKSHDIDADSFNSSEYSKGQSVDNLPVDAMLKEIYSQIHRKSTSEMKLDPDDNADMQSNEYIAELEQKVVDAIKEYLGQKFNIGKDFTEIQKVQHSREIMEALQIPHSDDELFVELAQNPNSVLLKYIRSLHDMSTERGEEPKSHEFSEVRPSEELVDHKQRLFFRRKVKHRGRNLSRENENSDKSSKIVILKPGPKGLLNSEADTIHPSVQVPTANDKRKVLNERVSSNFFLSEIKRKFKYAMGKDHHELAANGSDRIPSDHHSERESEKSVIKENGARNSTSKDHFFIERISRPSTDGTRGEKAGKLKSLEINQDLGNIYTNRRSPSNIYVEAKKHLSEMLSSGDESVDFLRGHVPKTLGRILSLPEYNFSPINSPRRDCKLSPVTSEKRISSSSRLLSVNESMPSFRGESNDIPISPGKSPLCISDSTPNAVQPPIDDNHNINRDLVDQSIREEAVSASTNGKISEGDIESLKANEIAVHEERSFLEAPSESIETSLSREDQNGEMPDACNYISVSDVPSDPVASPPIREDHNNETPDMLVEEPSISLPQDQGLSEENQSPPSPSASHSTSVTPGKGVGDLDGGSDVPERPSPVSVLEPLFIDDNMSPVHAMSRPGLPIQPVHIEFDDREPAESDKANIPKSLKEDKEVIFDYVKAVLSASGLTWNQICVRWLSSEQLLDLLLIEEVDLFPNQLCSDQKLLFDCISEVLADVCQNFPPWFSFVKPCLRSDYLVEVCEGVYWHLLPLPQPLTLDHLVTKDMNRTRTWINIHSDAESIGTETCDAIFDDLVDDTILSCVYINHNLISSIAMAFLAFPTRSSRQTNAFNGEVAVMEVAPSFVDLVEFGVLYQLRKSISCGLIH